VQRVFILFVDHGGSHFFIVLDKGFPLIVM
jgi:hypothetical protein